LVGHFPIATANPAADCEAFSSSFMDPLASTDVTFTCAADSVAYFGTCDSGGVPNDDLFEIVFTLNGAVVSNNYYVNGIEYVNIGQAAVTAGTHLATLTSLNVGVAEATYSYAVSSDVSAVSDYLGAFCGVDFQAGTPAGVGCFRDVPVFTTDTAPSNGTLEFRIMLGNEDARERSGLMKTWQITAGQQLNNDVVSQVHGPRYARLYWQPAGSGEWFLLTSQYWHNEGTTADEYGVACEYPAQASYHTSFASAVPIANVCFDLLNGC
jgi:hypothetical protein